MNGHGSRLEISLANDGILGKVEWKDANFVQECLGCHTPMKDNDWGYTHPAKLP